MSVTRRTLSFPTMPTSERAVAVVRAIASSGALRAAPGLLDQSRWRGPRPAAVRIERSRVQTVAPEIEVTEQLTELLPAALGAASAFVARQEAGRLGRSPRLLLREPGKDDRS